MILKIHRNQALLLSLAAFLFFFASPVTAHAKELSSDIPELTVVEVIMVETAVEEITEETATLPELPELPELTEEIPTDIAPLFKESLLAVSKTGMIVDSFQGVDALYRPGRNDGSNQTYSCAAFIKNYYSAIYNTKVNNLFYRQTPNAIGADSFVKVTAPQIGDIAAEDSGRSTTHWSVVKQVRPDGSIVLIEQNWKWQQDGKTMTAVNRTIKQDSARFYRLKSQITQ